MNKRKAKTLIDSDSENDAGSDSDTDMELLGLSKKKAANGNDAIEEKKPPPVEEDSDSETSDSDSDWDVPKNKKRKKDKPGPQKAKIKGSGSEQDDKESGSELEEGEVSNSSPNNSDDSEVDSDLEFDDGLDDKLMAGEEDEKRLAQMTEIEREQELFNRIEKREVLRARFEIEKKLKLAKKQQQSKKKGKDSADKIKEKKIPTMLTDRKKTLEENKLSKNDKFAALKAKREDKLLKAEEREKKEKEMEEKKRKEKVERSQETDADGEESKAKHKLKPSEVFSSDESDSDSDKSSKSEKVTKKKRSSSSSSSSSSSDSESDSGRSQGSYAAREREQPKFISTKEEVEKIRLSRFKMEKFVHLPVFMKVVVGCFVRIGIGNNQGRSVYRVAEVVDVVETAKIYNLGNTRTNKGLKLRHGNQERVYRLEFVSNTPFSETEFQKWIETCAEHSVILPTCEHIKKKQKDIQDLLYYQFTNEDIEKIVQEKARFNSNPTNFAVAKTLLLKEREMASQKGDDDTVERINSQMSELEEKAISLDKRRTSTIASISYINERNRKNNVEKAEKAILAESEERKGLKTEDPFTRRSTRPTMMGKDPFMNNAEIMSTELLLKLEEERRQKVENEQKKKDEEKELKKLEEEKKKEDEKKRDVHNDPYAAHNFEIKIDLDVNSPASAAPLAPRSTPTTTTNGTTANTAPKRSLKFEEYKRKKGLL